MHPWVRRGLGGAGARAWLSCVGGAALPRSSSSGICQGLFPRRPLSRESGQPRAAAGEVTQPVAVIPGCLAGGEWVSPSQLPPAADKTHKKSPGPAVSPPSAAPSQHPRVLHSGAPRGASQGPPPRFLHSWAIPVAGLSSHRSLSPVVAEGGEVAPAVPPAPRLACPRGAGCPPRWRSPATGKPQRSAREVAVSPDPPRG